jgi:uncharacterized protein
MADRRPRLVVFLRAARPGRVKTRLGREIGMIEAAWWYRHQVARLLRRIGRDPRWETWLAVTPDRGPLALPGAAGLPMVPQGSGDLGARMARVFHSFPPGPVMIVGGDIPGIRPAHLAEAFAMLGREDAVFGPTPDGGYWLVGLARGLQPAPVGLFEGVRWSTSHALADTLMGLAGMRIGFAAPLADVDTAADLALLSADPEALPFP